MTQGSDELLSNLKVIGMVKENGKLCIRNGHLSLELNNENQDVSIINLTTWIQTTLKRWWNHDNRTNNIVMLQSIIHTSILFCEDIIKKEEHIQTSNLLKRYYNTYCEVLIGLSNLKKTYDGDASIVARLIVLHEKVLECKEIIEKHLFKLYGE